MAKRTRFIKKNNKKDYTKLIPPGVIITAIILTIVDDYLHLVPIILGYTTVSFLIIFAGYLFYRFGPFKLNYKRDINPHMVNVDCMDGIEFEHFLKPLFEAKGYKAEVTQGSGDYGADLILTRKGKKTVVQVKCYSNNIGVSAVQQAVAAKPFYRAHNAIVVTNQYYTKQAKKLAKVNHVKLIDRSELFDMITDYKDGTKSVLNRMLAPFSLRLDRD